MCLRTAHCWSARRDGTCAAVVHCPAKTRDVGSSRSGLALTPCPTHQPRPTYRLLLLIRDRGGVLPVILQAAPRSSATTFACAHGDAAHPTTAARYRKCQQGVWSHTGIKVLRKRRTRTASESGLHGDPRIGKLQAIRYDVSSSRHTISAAPAPPIEAPPQARFLQTATLGWIGTWWAHWVDAIDSRLSVLAGVDKRCVLSARLSPSCSLALSLLFATMAEKGYPGLFERRAV